MDNLRFDASYREQARLRDGSVVELRVVQPSDRDLLREAFAHLSPQSRYLRFFTSKPTLSESELRYLTELDGMRHFAIGACRCAGGRETGVGIARFVCERANPAVADVAIAVVDELQGCGLGTLLLSRLADAARERGITHFSCDVLSGNAPMLALLDDVAGVVPVEQDGVIHVVYPLADEPTRDSLAYRLLRLAAQDLLHLRCVFDR